MKKTLILTHKLGANYGGILQAYALQQHLKKQGLTVATSSPYRQDGKLIRTIKTIATPLLSLATGKPKISQAKYEVYTNKFISKYITTDDIFKNGFGSQDAVRKYGNIVVGSDQVWRASYVDIGSYMLDFTSGLNIRRITYAASFGTDDLSEYSPTQLDKASKLITHFDAISVREKSGVDIVKNYWGIQSDQHVDPVFLLSGQDIAVLIDSAASSLHDVNGDIFSYVLDGGTKSKRLVEAVSSRLGLTTYNIMPRKPKSKKDLLFAHTDKFSLPPVEQWLKSFVDAKFVITDSFHGCVLSIILNKPFLAIGNKERGLTRFTSLLSMFNLQDRLVSSADEITSELILSDINWSRVNESIKNEQRRSDDYLRSHLGIGE